MSNAQPMTEDQRLRAYRGSRPGRGLTPKQIKRNNKKANKRLSTHLGKESRA